MKPAGQYRYKVDIERRASAQDDMGGESTVWGVMARALPACKDPVSDGEKLRAAQEGSEITDRFTVRWAPRLEDLDAADRLWLRRSHRASALYNVVGVKPIGFHQELEITANAVPETSELPALTPWVGSLGGGLVVGPSGPSGQIITIPWVVDGGGLPLNTGLSGHINLDFDAVLLGWTMLADQTGTTTLDLWRCTFDQFDPAGDRPGLADSITGSTPPNITAGEKASGLSAGWSTGLHRHDVLGVAVLSSSNHTRVTLGLRLQKV